MCDAWELTGLDFLDNVCPNIQKQEKCAATVYISNIRFDWDANDLLSDLQLTGRHRF